MRLGKKRLGKKLALATSGLISLFSLTSCSSRNISGLGFEKGVTSVSDNSLSLWQGAWITAGIVGLFTLILILWPAIRHRRKGDEFPRQTQYNIPTEIAYTIIPFIIVAVLFYFTAKSESAITKIDKNKPEKPIKANDHLLDALRYVVSMTQYKIQEIDQFKYNLHKRSENTNK